jgi:DNA-binding transcriptional LysR family regulator
VTLPIAIHGIDSRLRAELIAGLSARHRKFRVVYNSPNVGGQLAVAESGMAVAVITRCSLPSSLIELDVRHGVPVLPEVEVAIVRSRGSTRSAAVDAMHEHVARALRGT